MSWLDDASVDEFEVRAPTVQDVAQRWPLTTVLIVSGLGLLASFAGSWSISAIAYAVLLIAGCGLLFYRRFDAISATRSAGGSAILTVQPVEKAAIAALSLACLANGFVLALEIASWPVWAHLRERLN